MGVVPICTPLYFFFKDSVWLTCSSPIPFYYQPANKLQRSPCLYLTSARIIGVKYNTTPNFLNRFWGSEIRPSCLWDKRWTDWAISTAPSFSTEEKWEHTVYIDLGNPTSSSMGGLYLGRSSASHAQATHNCALALLKVLKEQTPFLSYSSLLFYIAESTRVWGSRWMLRQTVIWCRRHITRVIS